VVAHHGAFTFDCDSASVADGVGKAGVPAPRAGAGYTALTGMRRKPNAEERRRDLCDAAIELLAEDGARGLTHLRVDRRARVADGSTSFYFQARSALLRGATDRVVQLDVADFTAAMNQAKRRGATRPNRPPQAGGAPAIAIG
jgi:hypothetical protein